MKNIEYTEYVEKALDEADKEAEITDAQYYSYEEIFSVLRRKINE